MTNISKKQISKNLITNILVFTTGIIFSIFMTPFYIKHIGTDALGIIRLAFIIPMYTGLLTIVISGAVGRFLTIDIQKKAYISANQTFNTAFFSFTALLLLMIPIILFISYNLDSIFNIEDKFLDESRYLFLLILLSSLILLFSGLFTIPAYSHNRLDVINLARLITEIGKPLLIIFFILYVSTKLEYIGYANILMTLIVLIYSLFIWKRFAPKIIISPRFFKFQKLKDIWSMGSWLFLNQLSFILFVYIDLIIINLYFDSTVTGEYSTVLQWSTLLRTLSVVIGSILGPIFIIKFAKNEIDSIIRITSSSIKVMGLVMAIAIGIIFGLTEPILYVWLGKGFLHLKELMWLLILPLSISLCLTPLHSIFNSFNKVKFPSIIGIITAILHIVLTIVFLEFTSLGIYSIATSALIILIIRNLFLFPLYGAKILSIKSRIIYKAMIPGFILFLILSFLGIQINELYFIDNWLKLLITVLFLIIFSIIIIWFIFLSINEKNKLLSKFIIKANKYEA